MYRKSGSNRRKVCEVCEDKGKGYKKINRRRNGKIKYKSIVKGIKNVNANDQGPGKGNIRKSECDEDEKKTFECKVANVVEAANEVGENGTMSDLFVFVLVMSQV
ncbi:22088_t:CDS:2, partial [Gigaspora rosea]